jgi:hypothetical protein
MVDYVFQHLAGVYGTRQLVRLLALQSHAQHSFSAASHSMTRGLRGGEWDPSHLPMPLLLYSSLLFHSPAEHRRRLSFPFPLGRWTSTPHSWWPRAWRSGRRTAGW